MRDMRLLSILLALCAAFYCWMYFQSRVVRVEHADVYLRDLPQQFDGIRVLYVSDIHIASAADARHTQRLMEQLRPAQVDLILLGGDYSDVRLWDQLRCLGSEKKMEILQSRAAAHARAWLMTLGDLGAPLGIYAVAGNHDSENPTLRSDMADAGIYLLENESAVLARDGAQLIIAGTGDRKRGDFDPHAAAAGIRAEDCCILLSHNPDALPALFTVEAEGGGHWIDLALSGHTHGGQLRFGNWVPINKSEYGLKHLTGWQEQIGAYALTSNGVGTTALPVRFGAPAQVHVITLHCAQ